MISVIIPAFNEEKTIGATLKSLQEQDFSGQFEVIVVDNGSTDRTGKIARSFAACFGVRVVEEKRHGRGAARVRGAGEAHGSVLAYIDADTVATNGWLSEIARVFKDDGIAAATGPWKAVGVPSSTANALELFQEPAQLPFRARYGHFWLNGMNMAIAKGAYEKAGGFRADLNAHEDIDITLRLRKFGKVVYSRNMLVRSSARRYKNGFWPGLFSYYKPAVGYLLGKSIDLKNIR